MLEYGQNIHSCQIMKIHNDCNNIIQTEQDSIFRRNRQLLKHTDGKFDHIFNPTKFNVLDSQQNHAQTSTKQQGQSKIEELALTNLM